MNAEGEWVTALAYQQPLELEEFMLESHGLLDIVHSTPFGGVKQGGANAKLSLADWQGVGRISNVVDLTFGDEDFKSASK